MKRVLVTGASGFLGRRLISRLEKDGNYELFAVTTHPNGLAFPARIRVETADLLDVAAIKGLLERVYPDICIHLAWDQREGYRNSLSNYHWLAASTLLFAEFQRVGGRQFLFAGSSGEYEDQSGHMAEVPRPRPMSLYGQCKKAVSELILASESNMWVQVARFFTIYGPGDPHRFGAIPSAICTLLQGKIFSCQHPNAIRDYIYIDDAVEAIVRLLFSDYHGVVNIGSGFPHSMREVFLEIGKQLNCPEKVVFAGEASGETVLVSDNTILQNAVGFTPRTDLSEGVAECIAYWRTQLGDERCGP